MAVSRALLRRIDTRVDQSKYYPIFLEEKQYILFQCMKFEEQ